jgi:predicted TIM-barrel fold metal-dependent hydrolase
MKVDALSLLGTSRFGYRRTADETIRDLDAEGIAAAVVAPVHPPDGDLAAANREVAGEVHRSDGRLVGLARVAPWDGDAALAELTRAVGDGARGVFLDPAEDHFAINDVRWRPIAERAAELGVPVVVATGFPWLAETQQVARFARWCPDVPVVLTNGGVLNISGGGQYHVHQALAGTRTCVLTNGMYRDDYLALIARKFGPDRLLFGSVAPRFDARFEHRRAGRIDLTDEERALVMGGNAARLFGIG